MTTASIKSPQQLLQRYLGFLKYDPDNVSLRADIFDLALRCGANNIARQQARHALAAAPDAPAWINRLAMLEMAQQRYVLADALLADLQARGVENEGVIFNRAYSAFCQQKYALACAMLKPLSVRSTLSPILPLYLRCLHRLGNIDEALRYFQQQLANGLAGDIAYGVASLLALDAGRLPLAKSWAAQALQGHPLQVEALVTRASLALAMQDADAAEVDLRKALDINAQDGRVRSALGIVCLLRQQFAAASDNFLQAVKLLPGHIGSWHGLGWCQLLRQDALEARNSFEQALALDRNFAESHGALAAALARIGKLSEAQTHVARALRLDRHNLAARYAQALINGEVEDIAAFKRTVKRVIGDRTVADGRSLAGIVLGA